MLLSVEGQRLRLADVVVERRTLKLGQPLGTCSCLFEGASEPICFCEAMTNVWSPKYSAYLIYVRLRNMLDRYVFSPNMYARMFCI